MNTKTSFSYSLITLALWSTYSFGADNVIAGTDPTYGGNNGNNIIAGDGTTLYSNARNNIMNTTGNTGFGGSYSLVIGEKAGHDAGNGSGNAKYIFAMGENAADSSWGNSTYKFVFGKGAGWNGGGNYNFSIGEKSGRQVNGHYNFTIGQDDYSHSFKFTDSKSKEYHFSNLGIYNFSFGEGANYES